MQSKDTAKLAPGDEILVRRAETGRLQAATPRTPLLDRRTFAAIVTESTASTKSPTFVVKYTVKDKGHELPVKIGSEGTVTIHRSKQVCLSSTGWRDACAKSRLKKHIGRPQTLPLFHLNPGEDILVKITYADIGHRPQAGFDPKHDKLTIAPPFTEGDATDDTKHLLCFAAQIKKMTPVHSGEKTTGNVMLQLEKIDNGQNHLNLPESFRITAPLQTNACIAGTMWRLNSQASGAKAAR